MKYTTASMFAFVIGALVVAACGGSEAPAQVDDDSSQSNATKSDAGTDAGKTTKDEPKECVSSCTTDSECANSCPATTGGPICCDLVTKTCFNSTQSTCPKTDPDGGGFPFQY